MEITFIQPRHNYAWEDWLWHIHLSSPLLSVKARLLAVLWNNQTIRFIDANFENPNYQKLTWIVWVNLVWAPYIPEVIKIIEQISENTTILLWWQIISSLTDSEFQELFNKRGNVINWNVSDKLEELFNLEKWSITDVENVNLIEAYKDIGDEEMKEYLEREFSIYLSQWCKYNCSFCQALKKKPEKYRDLSLFEGELLYLLERAESFWLKNLIFYLSNLDIFQTPDLFSQFLDVIEKVTNTTDIKIQFRWLAWVDSFLSLYYNDQSLLVRAQKLWLTSVWYGIDWATPEVWKSIWKWQNFKWNSSIWWVWKYSEQEKAIDTIKYTKELGITPEVLMVFWHPWETNESLEKAYSFCKDMLETYWALPRPHISKTIIPWSDWWYKEQNQDLVRIFVDNPEYFQALDYTALPSELTHPDKKIRNLARKWYKKICALSPQSTQYIIPNTSEYQKIADRLGTTVEQMNKWKFDR